MNVLIGLGLPLSPAPLAVIEQTARGAWTGGRWGLILPSKVLTTYLNRKKYQLTPSQVKLRLLFGFFIVFCSRLLAVWVYKLRCPSMCFCLFVALPALLGGKGWANNKMFNKRWSQVVCGKIRQQCIDRKNYNHFVLFFSIKNWHIFSLFCFVFPFLGIGGSINTPCPY